MKRLRVCFDLDGVVCWAEYPEFGKVRKDVLRLMKYLREDYDVVVWTSREEPEREQVARFLQENNIPCDELIMGKPQALIYVDDRAINVDQLNVVRRIISRAKNELRKAGFLDEG